MKEVEKQVEIESKFFRDKYMWNNYVIHKETETNKMTALELKVSKMLKELETLGIKRRFRLEELHYVDEDEDLGLKIKKYEEHRGIWSHINQSKLEAMRRQSMLRVGNI